MSMAERMLMEDAQQTLSPLSSNNDVPPSSGFLGLGLKGRLPWEAEYGNCCQVMFFSIYLSNTTTSHVFGFILSFCVFVCSPPLFSSLVRVLGLVDFSSPSS